MPANPIIKAVSASKEATSTLIMALLDNNSRGMVQVRAYMDASCVTEDIAMRGEGCIGNTSNIYIPDLYWLVNAYKTETTAASRACLSTYTCSAGENCDTPACSAWNVFNSSTDITISNVFGATPIAVSNLTLTPGDKSISVSWGDINQTTSIFAYKVSLFQDTTEMISGWVLDKNIVINNLTNGTPYKVSVKAGSFDGFGGPLTEKTATPIVTCTIPSCKITIT